MGLWLVEVVVAVVVAAPNTLRLGCAAPNPVVPNMVKSCQRGFVCVLLVFNATFQTTIETRTIKQRCFAQSRQVAPL